VAIAVAPTPDQAERNIALGRLAATSGVCTEGDLGSLIVASATPRGAIAVVLTYRDGPDLATCVARGYAGCIVARRRFTFLDGVELALNVRLQSVCRDVGCDVLSSCHDSVCFDSETPCDSDGTCAPLGTRRDDAGGQGSGSDQDGGLGANDSGGDGSPTDSGLLGGCLDDPTSCNNMSGGQQLVCCARMGMQPACVDPSLCGQQAGSLIGCRHDADCPQSPIVQICYQFGPAPSGVQQISTACRDMSVVGNGYACLYGTECNGGTKCLKSPFYPFVTTCQ
jgi:hypothetical protein